MMFVMRLSPEAVRAIREEVRLLDAAAEVILHSSRADDTQRGGDIDLLVITDKLGLRDLLRLRRGILDRIGWQQLDLVLRRRDQLDEPLATVARETGTNYEA
jgi:predicted nucleotidyltransferase